MDNPKIGELKITVEMNEGIFEEFMQFRKDREAYLQKAEKQANAYRCRMDNLANAVLQYFNAKNAKQKAEAKADAIEYATDWIT